MNWRSPHLWIGVMSALAVVGLAAVDYGRTSPGPLSAVHQREDALQGRGGCADCHGGWTRSMGEACLDCHAAVAEHIEEQRGLHGGIGEDAMECAACHSDHHGARFQAVNRQSFARAGVADVASYDHGLYGFPIGGGHDELDCAECHENVEAKVLGLGEHRYLGLDADCGACHENPHEERLIVSCAACHGQESFDVLGSFGHEDHLPLVGGHGDLACADCHAAEGPHALRAVGTVLGDGVRGEPRGCLDCHESPHELEFERSVGREVGGGREGGCLHCHRAEHETFERGLEQVTGELHALTGFLLEEPHTEVSCAECHGEPDAGTFDARYPGRGANQCGRCHDDPHGGQFEQGCIACHADTHFEPHTFTVEMHARGSFPLTGEHLDADCAACHADPHGGTPRVFAGTTGRCDGCHADAHDGFFEDHARKDVLASIEQDSCGVCHQTASFDDELASFDHGRSTGFPVAGAHAQEGCESCHPRSPVPDADGRTLGRVHEEFGRFRGCETCHADPHEGAFDAAWCPQEVRGKQGCARCHEQTSFRVFPDGFDHHRWTRYRLDGAHAEADCSSCHAPLHAADEVGRTWGRAAGTSCADCHADPHGGQFELGFDAHYAGPPKSCESCHSSASAFDDLAAFDHTLETGFPLGEAHGTLDCGACHPTEVVGGEPRVRYRPLDGNCATCHGTHDPARMKRVSPGRRRDR